MSKLPLTKTRENSPSNSSKPKTNSPKDLTITLPLEKPRDGLKTPISSQLKTFSKGSFSPTGYNSATSLS